MKIRKLFLWITLFSVAMAFLESSVVVYIRELLYPNGFDFPLAEMNSSLAITEIFRELATMIMLVSVAYIAGKSFSQRFAWFIYCFAVWDVFYYVFLKILIGWPSSFLEWDVLFLIPLTWTGPVISPLIVCVFMISLSAFIIYFSDMGLNSRISKTEWLLLISGALILITAFTWDYSGFVLEHYSLSEIWNLPDNKALFDLAISYIPRKFNWWIFSAGSLIIMAAILLYYKRMSTKI